MISELHIQSLKAGEDAGLIRFAAILRPVAPDLPRPIRAIGEPRTPAGRSALDVNPSINLCRARKLIPESREEEEAS